MDDSRFLIVGAKGQVGIALKNKFPNAITTDRETLDITDWQSIDSYDWDSVDVILNAAAFTNVDGAESAEGRQAAWAVNAQSVAYLAKAAVKKNKAIVHFSSDYVFDGTEYPHTEDEPVTPLGVYAQSKAAGDIAVTVAPKHYILRTSWVIGEGKNFVRTMVGLAEKNISPTVVSDQIGRITFTSTLADAAEHLLANNAGFGIYNVSNDGEPASWAQITRAIFAELGRDDLTVTDSSTQDYFKDKPEASPRPLHSELDLSKIKAAGLQLRDWREDLKTYIQAEKKENAQV